MTARLFVSPERLGGPRLVLDGDAHKHLSRVLRLGPGDELVIFDGAGFEVDARVVASGSKTTEVELGARRAIAVATTRVTLLQAVAKGERMDVIVQKTTELGVTRIVPVLAHRSVARPAPGDTRHTRWTTIAREAARQCGRADVPLVEAPVSLEAALATCPADAARFILWEEHRGGSLPRALAGVTAEVALLVGPEGGFEAREVDAARAAGFEPVGLGPRILRTETAAIVAVALTQAALGGLG